MAKPRTNTLLSRGRPIAIVLLLSAALLLIGLLGWQSWQLQQSHSATADSVLREYGILVADEFGRRAIAGLGYQGYYTLVTRIAGFDSPAAMREQADTDATLADAADLAATYLVIRPDTLEVEGARLSSQMETLIRRIREAPSHDDAPYQSSRTADGKEQVIFAPRSTPDGKTVITGFVVSAAGIGEHLRKAFDRGPLLPSSLAEGQVSNEMLFARVTDPGGTVLFEQNPAFDSRLTIQKTLGAEYQGILESFQIEVSLDPDAAELLLIGGLPESRLPLLLFAMALVVALMLTAIWLFRREQAVMKLRTDFVSQVSHELRTPLTQIRMFAETLLMNRTRNEEERHRSLEIINRESQRLSHLVDNILRFSNGAEATQVDRREQPLAPIIREVCDIVSSTENSVTITLFADESARASVDADAIRQVVLNLLDNAIKYGPSDQTITVSLKRDGHISRLSVEDEGPGIPESERKHVWSPFYRLRREDETAISGTGIGLSVVKELAGAMGGHCRIEDGAVGARICIEFEGETPDE
jgi:signal transduction histidine kinase